MNEEIFDILCEIHELLELLADYQFPQAITIRQADLHDRLSCYIMLRRGWIH